MIIYSIKVVIKRDVEDSWLKWMQEKHIKEVMKTGYFTNWEMQKLLLPEIAADESTYIINYECPSLDEYDKYTEMLRLQKEHLEKFSSKFRASRAIYQLIP
jgi:hypothetical protein